DIRVISGKSLFDAVEVYNRSDDQEVEIDEVEIDGDTLVITLEDPLEDGDTFEVTIKADYFEEEDTGDNFEGIEGNDWRFTTR
ncbi:MAG: putative membrane protein, partial [Pelotomaculum thermopropionicum]